MRATIQRRRRFSARRRRPLRWWQRALAFLCFLAVLVVALDIQLHPLLIAHACNQAKLSAVIAINNAVTQELARGDADYDDLVSVSRADDGQVLSIQANIVPINRLKASLNSAIAEKLGTDDVRQLRIPLGSLIDSALLSGHGPMIPLRIVSDGTPIISLSSSFTQAGINQTLHHIEMDVKANMVVTALGRTTAVTVECNFMVAQTVLVGDVPDSYTDVENDRSDLVGQIFDYADLD